MTRTLNSPLVLVVLLVVLGSGCSTPDDSTREVAPEPHEEAGHARGEEHEEGVVELSPEALERAQIRTAHAELRRLEGQIETTGSVDFDQNRVAHVSPRLEGRVDEVAAQLGEEVRARQRLARIDSIELGQAKAAYLQAKARAELAQQSFERERGLYADRISSEQEMLTAQAAFREAQAALRAAEETLHLYGLSQEQVDSLHYDDPRASIYDLIAPFAGKVVEKHATLGELVTPGDTLFVLADLSRVWIWIDAYERDLSRVHLGDTVEVRAEAFPDDVARGEVSYLSDQVDRDTRTIRARIEVANPEGRLRPGMFVSVRVTDPHAAADVGTVSLAIPEAAAQRAGDGFVSFVPVGEERFEQRKLSLGRRAGGWVEVLAGLSEGEAVVTEGAFLLKSEAAKGELGGGHGH